MTCDKHPRYGVIRKPKPGCVICHAMWQEKLVWQENTRPIYDRAQTVLNVLREQGAGLDEDDFEELCDEVENGIRTMWESARIDWDAGPRN
jgi:hypothetical protein